MKIIHFVCSLPKKSECNVLKKYSTIAREAFKNSSIENMCLYTAETIEQSAFENCKELAFIAFGGNDILSNSENAEEMHKEKTNSNNNSLQLLKKLYCIEDKNELQLKYNHPLSSSNDTIFKSDKLSSKPVLIQNSAFKGCDKLETVIFPKNKCIIEKDAFAHCKALRTIVLPGGDTELYDDPFIGCKDLTIICQKGDQKVLLYGMVHSIRVIEIDIK